MLLNSDPVSKRLSPWVFDMMKFQRSLKLIDKLRQCKPEEECKSLLSGNSRLCY
jgi:hypothetical protein